MPLERAVSKLVLASRTQARALVAEGRVTVNGVRVTDRESHLVLTLTEGRNREVRRLLAAAGHPVTRLRRVEYGGLALGALAPGAWREVTAAELRRAFPGRPQARKRAPSPK